MPACIKEYDNLVTQFLNADSEIKQTLIYEEAQNLMEEYDEGDLKNRAKIYVKTMEKVTEKGQEFIGTEITRVKKLTEGTVSSNKMLQLRDRVNILSSFQMRVKDEL